MPTFDFQCTVCNHKFEFARPFGSTKIPACPKCGKTNVQKLITPPTIHFKGKGFYKTDSVKKVTKKKKSTKKTKSAKKPSNSAIPAKET